MEYWSIGVMEYWSDGIIEDYKFQITNHKYQANHKDQSACGGPNLLLVLVI